MHRPAAVNHVHCVAVACTALLALTTGCASSGESVRQDVTIVLDVTNDLTPTGDVIVSLYPIWGDLADRIEIGVVRGAEREQFRVTVPTDRYILGARPLFSRGSYTHPITSGRGSSGGSTERFNITTDTRRVEWHVRARSAKVVEGDVGS